MEKRFLSLAIGGLLTIGVALEVFVPTAWATSYLAITDGPTRVDEKAPPCDKTRKTTYSVTLQNNNGPLFFCSEDVNPVRLASKVEAGLDGDFDIKDNPIGSAKFLGFKKNKDDPPDSKLTFIGMATGEENAITFFFDIETGPANVPGLGLCDFEDAKFAIVICDGGGSCDQLFWADPPDPICESPAKFIPSVFVESDKIFCPASVGGTAKIQGTVTNDNGNPAGNAHVSVKRGCRGQAGFVDQNTTTPSLPPAERGKYTVSNLPGPATYTVEARDNGMCATAIVNVTAAGQTVTQDFTLTNSCN
jgi:hypothetical protein